jgi:predicted alpha/beta hydrolase
VLIAPATAVPQGYYAKFARYLAATQGFRVVTLDYRGIGRSKPERRPARFQGTDA